MDLGSVKIPDYGTVILSLLLPLAIQAQPCRALSADGSSLATCDIYIQDRSTLTVANGTIMTTSGGILNDNINWAIGSSATLGTSSTLRCVSKYHFAYGRCIKW